MEVPGEQVGLSLPRPSPLPSANWSEGLRFTEGSLCSRRTRDRKHQPLVGTLTPPGWGTYFVGLMILAGELLIVARFLDRTETILRGPARRAKGFWASVPAVVRLLIVVIVPVRGVALGLWALLAILR